ncbi:MAG: hypothetical protein U9R28_07630 [Pseudomonadota bacterium]|nr:hypothetical protein [Pseudomonadota bacterium]
MKSTIVTLTLLGSLSFGLSGCSVLNKGTEYQVPDYYKTGLVVDEYVAGKTYYVKDLRCSERSGGCHLEKAVIHRNYEKPYYLSK